jgi:Zn-finger nucleic acid-binding protein
MQNANAMNAITLHCPTCGASLSSDETSCRYCGSRLATIACPKCFGMMFVGSKFCPHCGARAEQPVDIGPALNCPDCKTPMTHVLLKQTPLQECQRCFGVWVDTRSFERICADRERQADPLDSTGTGEMRRPPKMVPQPVRYRPCPQCGQLMNRFNFGRTSGIVIDKCAAHGIWFDRDELQRIIDFVQAGGMEIARQREWEEQTRRIREQQAEKRAAAVDSILRYDGNRVGIALNLLGGLF